MPRPKAFCEVSVLEKATALFWKQGFNATSIQQLVDHLGINRASLYDTYGGKEALFQKAFEHYRKGANEKIETYLASQSNVKEGFRTFFHEALKDAQKDEEQKGCFVINTVSEFLPCDCAPKVQESIQSNQASIIEHFSNFIQKGMDSGEISGDKDARAIAEYFYALYSGLMLLSRIDQQQETQLGVIDTALNILD